MTGVAMATPTLLYRNAFADHKQVVSRLVAEVGGGQAPFVTIAIPTFRRADLLVEAVRSCLAQAFDRPVEIVIVDNDPASTGADALIAALPPTTTAVRYFVNAENIGAFPNWSRGIELARAPWVMVLNDDDLLEPGCLALAFAEIDRDPSIDGIALRKRYFDDRDTPVAPQSFARRNAARLMRAWLYRGANTRALPASRFFWGAVFGNSGGFVFRRSAAIDVGGFYPEEHPSSDNWFFLRFAHRYRLRQHATVGAAIRLSGDQISSSSVLQQLEQGYRLRATLLGSIVPRWWRPVSAYLSARHLAEFKRTWGVTITEAEVGQKLGIDVPRDNKYLLSAVRLLLGGY